MLYPELRHETSFLATLLFLLLLLLLFFFQAEDGIRDLVRSRGLGDVYKRQLSSTAFVAASRSEPNFEKASSSR